MAHEVILDSPFFRTPEFIPPTESASAADLE
ncbi:hypothetical protein J2T20_004934 [Paenibacillus wynnii]|nr:hypothetical protein [Paenibacillus wynnii]